MNRFLIWGTGKLTKQFVENGYNGEIIGFIETNKSKEIYMGKPVYDSSEIPNDYDYIIVANSYTTEIYSLCLKKGMDMSKIIYLYPVKKKEGYSESGMLKELLLDKNYTNYCAEFDMIDESFVTSDMEQYTKLNQRVSFNVQKQYMYPIIYDKYKQAGAINNYFWQDLWAAQLIYRSGIKMHFDIGSRIDGFIAHLLAADIEVTLIDIREFPVKVNKLYTIVDDATSLHQLSDGSIESMSALCSLEHFGLGRYGDPIDPEACFKCFANIQKKLKEGGHLYISVPVGNERVEFNAHRVFYAVTIVECFSDLMLEEFSCITAEGIEYNVDIHKYDEDTHNGEYRYGLFHFIKKPV